MNLGFIGLGIMGRAMVQNLINAGHSLFVYNRTGEKCMPFVEKGAVACDTPAGVASHAGVIFINVTDSAAVESVLFGPDGLADTASAGNIIIDHSTISPLETQKFARRLKEKNIDFLDAPVSGGDVGARNATLAIMVGGDKAAFEKSLPLLNILGKKIVYLGPSGAGQACKAVNQLFCALHMIACCEGIELARRAGLDPLAMIDVVSSGAGGSWALANLGPKIVNQDFAPGFTIDLLAKDLAYTLELARIARLPLAGTSLAQQLFALARQQDLGPLATQALAKVIQNIAE
jgi:3-hydroxyisobutyrate dehydrogenase